MADERDFDLLDDYLTDRMSEADRTAFEQRIEADPDLQHERALQQRLINGIRESRVAELKSMLNKVPVPPNHSGSAVASKFIVGTIVTIIIAAAGYWYFTREDNKISTQETATVSKQSEQIEESVTPEAAQPEKQSAQQQPAPDQELKVQADKNQTSAGTEHSKPSLAKKPEPLQAPGAKAQKPETQKGTASAASTASSFPAGNVKTDTQNSQYAFHYQFRDGTLLLFGPFAPNTYEVIELNTGDEDAVFLHYQDDFYHLSQANADPRALTPLTDPNLLRQLREYQESR